MRVKGSLTCTSGVFKGNNFYSEHTHFTSEDGKIGTNPEELIAVAHAACYSKALSFLLSNEGFSPKEIRTEAILSAGLIADPSQINSIHLDVVAKVPEIEEDAFMKIAEKAKNTCPISQVRLKRNRDNLKRQVRKAQCQ